MCVGLTKPLFCSISQTQPVTKERSMKEDCPDQFEEEFKRMTPKELVHELIGLAMDIVEWVKAFIEDLTTDKKRRVSPKYRYR